jgi:Protein of unknown function (DUF992)
VTRFLSTRVSTVTLLAAVSVLAAAPASAAPAQGQTKIGALECRVSGGVNLIITSTRQLDCVFRPAGAGAQENYAGTVRRLGVDISIKGDGVLIWGVFAPSPTRTRGALAGNYVGASASIAAGVGLGANALIGGFGKSIGLQPASLEGQTGIGISAGIADMRLDAVK